MLLYQKIHPNARIERNPEKANAYDVWVPYDTLGQPGNELKILPYPYPATSIKLGIALDLPDDFAMLFNIVRSSLGAQQVIVYGGLIDSSWKYDITIYLTNFSGIPVVVPEYKAVVQGLLVHTPYLPLQQVDVITTQTVRENSGFGSTDDANHFYRTK